MSTIITNFWRFLLKYPLPFLLALALIIPSIAISQETETQQSEITIPTDTTEEAGNDGGGPTENEEVENIVEILQPFVWSPPPLSTRRFERKITLDKTATHSCEVALFKIDVSGKNLIQTHIALKKNANIAYKLEVGGLPDGIIIKFLKNSLYSYTPNSDELKIDLDIINENGSQKGNFSVPIIYTQKGGKNSSVICQINIINL